MNVVLIVIIYYIFIFTLIFLVQFICLSNLYRLKNYICFGSAKALKPNYLGPIQIQSKFHIWQYCSQQTPTPRCKFMIFGVHKQT